MGLHGVLKGSVGITVGALNIAIKLRGILQRVYRAARACLLLLIQAP